MRRQLLAGILAAVFSLALAAVARPTTGEKPLLVIDSASYAAVDFKKWWSHWQEEGMELPASPAPYIEWLLLAREAASMELDREESFRRKVEVFLKARSLVMYKNEVIDARTKVTEEELRNRYDAEYSPRSLVQVLYFNSEQAANAAYQDLAAGRQDMDAFKARAGEKDNDVYYQEQFLRPGKTKPEWRQVISALEVNGISRPLRWSKGFVLFRLKERSGFDEQDFNAHKETISHTLRKIHEAELTAALIEELKKTYQVEINRKPLAGLDLFGPPLENYPEEAVITTVRGLVSVREFVEMLRRHHTASRLKGEDGEKIEALKERVLGDIISQILTTWAALDRHYEERPPLQESYEFYRRHRLIKELESRLFMPKTEPGEEEINRYYQQHQDEFSQPATVTMARLEYTGEEIDRLWAEILTGKDFSATGVKYSGHEPFTRQVEAERLTSAEKEVVAKLAPNEVSPPFSEDGRWVLIKLQARKPASVKPLSEVSSAIGKKLSQEKFASSRAEYLAKLRSRVSITVNDEAWAALRAELTGK